MECLLMSTCLLLVTALVCSAAQTPEVEAKLTSDVDEIIHNDWIKLTCDAEKVGLPSDSDIVQVGLSRKLAGSKTVEERIATYKASSKPGPRLSIGAKYKNNKRWTIKGNGVSAENNGDSFNITALVNKTLCSDGGDYYCLVTYKDKNSKEEKQIKGHMNLPSAAEISNITVNGTDSRGKDILSNRVQEGDNITADCYVKGPKLLKLTWRIDGKVIGVDISPPEVQTVENHDPTPVKKDGDCQQYLHQSTLVFEYGSDIDFVCRWDFGSRARAVVLKKNELDSFWKTFDPTIKFHTPRKFNSFNPWYVCGPIIGLMGLCMLGLGTRWVVKTKRKYSNRPVQSDQSDDHAAIVTDRPNSSDDVLKPKY